jgi:hypothetical protein
MKAKHFLFFITLILFSTLNANAQLKTNAFKSSPFSRDKKNIFNLALYKQPGKDSMVDVIDGIYRIFKIDKKRSESETLTKPKFTFVPGVEYSLVTKFATNLKGSILIPSKGLFSKTSTVASEFKYTQNKQVITRVNSNLWINKDEYNINTSWSYMKYPQQDFGLGMNSKIDRFDNIDYSYFKMHQSIGKKIAKNIYFGPGLNIDLHWNILDSTTLNKPKVGFEQYGYEKTSNSVGVLLNLLYDSRTSIVSPKAKTAFLNIIFRDNLTFLGSDRNWQTLTIDARKYVSFPKNSKNILAFWTYNVLSLQGKAPYLDLATTAGDPYGNTGRGYIQSRFRGDKYISAETEYRFGITENGSLGGVIFANMQSASQQIGKPIDGIKTGFGGGIRIKLNKHSNTNIALDYGIGQDGSKGIFMNLGEVF